MKEAIHQAIQVFRRHPTADYGETVKYISAEVGDDDLAHRLMEFVPLAFARVAYANLGIRFIDKFARMLSPKKQSAYYPLTAEPLWADALAVAQEELARDVPEADVLAILRHSAIHNTVENARATGMSLEGALMSGSIMLRAAPLPPKKWWEFWK